MFHTGALNFRGKPFPEGLRTWVTNCFLGIGPPSLGHLSHDGLHLTKLEGWAVFVSS